MANSGCMSALVTLVSAVNRGYNWWSVSGCLCFSPDSSQHHAVSEARGGIQARGRCHPRLHSRRWFQCSASISHHPSLFPSEFHCVLFCLWLSHITRHFMPLCMLVVVITATSFTKMLTATIVAKHLRWSPVRIREMLWIWWYCGLNCL